MYRINVVKLSLNQASHVCNVHEGIDHVLFRCPRFSRVKKKFLSTSRINLRISWYLNECFANCILIARLVKLSPGLREVPRSFLGGDRKFFLSLLQRNLGLSITYSGCCLFLIEQQIKKHRKYLVITKFKIVQSMGTLSYTIFVNFRLVVLGTTHKINENQ